MAAHVGAWTACGDVDNSSVFISGVSRPSLGATARDPRLPQPPVSLS